MSLKDHVVPSLTPSPCSGRGGEGLAIFSIAFLYLVLTEDKTCYAFERGLQCLVFLQCPENQTSRAVLLKLHISLVSHHFSVSLL